MKEQFDKKLVEKIKDSFLNHEEPFDPKEWEKLSLSYFKPIKKKSLVWWPFITSGIAASLMLGFLFWPSSEDLTKNVKTITDSLTIDSKQFDGVEIPERTYSENRELQDSEKIDGKDKPASSLAGGIPKDQEEKFTIGNTEWKLPVLDIRDLLKTDPGSGHALSLLDSTQIDPRTESTLTEGTSKDWSAPEPDTDAQKWVDNWKNGEEEKDKEVETVLKNNQNVRLGLQVGPQAVSNPTSGMNLGAGIMSEFSFSKRLKLDVGVTYSRQSLVPEQNNIQTSETLDAYRTSSNFIGSSYELNFASLDIPVNVKYMVVDKPGSGLFVSTGLSSMVYLNQNTVETFSTNSLFTANTAQEGAFAMSSQGVQDFTSVLRPEGSEGGVDLGRMLNLSVGYEYNLKNGTYLSIEPYYKLPLGNMTFAEQRFSIGGLNLRMNFQLGK